MVEMVEKGSCSQDHEKDTAHGLKSVNAEVFDIETGLLVEAVGMLNLRATTPGDKHGLSLVARADGTSGE